MKGTRCITGRILLFALMLIYSLFNVTYAEVKTKSEELLFKSFYNKEYDANYYILSQNGVGVLIDAGGCVDEIVDYVVKHKIKIKYIILTHGHYDHMESVDVINLKLLSKTVLHKNDVDLYLENSIIKPDIFVKGGEVLVAGGLKFKILYTPGHTLGSISIVAGNNVFTGDTLFKGTIGRTDLEKGSKTDILNSIKNKLLTLKNSFLVYPGHAEYSTIGYERMNNPFLKTLKK